MEKIYVVFFLLLIMSACDTNDDCAATDPPPQSIHISILDTEGNSLIGENNIYKPTEITLDRGNQNIPLRFYDYDGKTFIELYYYDMESEKDYNLMLNQQETDILKLKINIYNTDCFTELKSVEKFLLNGEEIQRDNETYSYIIQK
ncbi:MULTISPECIES: hypothetical protein [Aequorivita]|uniref:Uncharacterized protein n=2 Tax=Aequorivita TaxID=153265 RepID=A0AB35YQK3_9FLAO|nr:hypothetical protein [Aequorivita sp. Ant34-E75]WGF91868.1 hypothetical protein QCQ61_11680 [Aequorivita sp. Ant34-E75]